MSDNLPFEYEDIVKENFTIHHKGLSTPILCD